MKKVFYFLLIGTFFTSCKSLKKNSQDILASHIDTSVVAGDDFNQYANGGWTKLNPIPEAYSNWGIGDLIEEDILLKKKKINEKAIKSNAKVGSNEQKIGDFYFSGMDTNSIEKNGIQPIEGIIKNIDEINSKEDITSTLAYLHSLGIDVFFAPEVWQDAKNSDVVALYISQSGIGLPNKDYYFGNESRTITIRNDYKNNFLPKMFSNISQKASANEIYNLEEKLAKASRELEELRDPYANYNKMSIAELQTKYPFIEWNKYFSELGAKDLKDVIVGQPEFLEQLKNIVADKNQLENIKNYFKLRTLLTYSKYLNKSIANENFRFYGKVIAGKKEQLPRWKSVLNTQEDLMGEILGQQFVKDYFPATAKKRYEDMVRSVMASYKNHIQELDWMSEATKLKAQKKLAAIKMKVGYPDKWKDFSTMKISRNAYCENIISANIWWHKYQMNKLGKPVDRNEWDMTPQTYNAYYNASNNEIVLPAGIFLIPGLKDADADDAMVYGYAGASTIGHELTHGFDDEGRQYDEKGNLNNWWTDEDVKNFNLRAQKVIDQFDNFIVLDSLHVNGEATLGENIADLGGIVIALDAFKTTKAYKENKIIGGYTPTQRFFLGYALGWMYHQRDEKLANQILTDYHAPMHLRINGPFSNVPEFYEAFNVKQGQKMWKPDSLRIKIW